MPEAAPSPVFALCDEHVERAAALDPVAASSSGIAGYDDLPTDYSPDGYAARAEHVAQTLRRLDATPVTGPADQLAADHLRERLQADGAWLAAGEHLGDVRGLFGPQQTVRDTPDSMPTDTADEWAAVAARLRQVPQMLAGLRATWAQGLDAGLAAARRQAVEAAGQARTWSGGAGDPAAHQPLVARYSEQHPDGPLAGELASAAAAAHQAYGQLADHLDREYAPRARDTEGVGADRHATWSRLALGADVDPHEAYAWGWAELHRIEADLEREADRVRPGAGVEEAVALLTSGSVPGATLDGVEAYHRWLQDRHDRAVDDLDGRHFTVDPAIRRVEVRLAPPGSGAAQYYTEPSEDLTRPGRTWWPVQDRTRFDLWDDLTTVFHEGVPGHHLQLAQAKVRGRDGELSRFARNSFVSGHGEGWALYAERLSDELGWFDEVPGARLGMLVGSAFRAARVVIDLGVHLDLPLPGPEAARHGARWSYQVAADVLRSRGRLAPHMVHSEVVRYLGWPAQATSYKLGERVWLAARDDARRRTGDGFDLRAWHTAALDLGPLGLDTLVSALARWTPGPRS